MSIFRYNCVPWHRPNIAMNLRTGSKWDRSPDLKTIKNSWKIIKRKIENYDEKQPLITEAFKDSLKKTGQKFEQLDSQHAPRHASRNQKQIQSDKILTNGLSWLKGTKNNIYVKLSVIGREIELHFHKYIM